jgi:hypothetical protein
MTETTGSVAAGGWSDGVVSEEVIAEVDRNCG